MDPITMSLLATAASGLLSKLMNPSKGYGEAQKMHEKYYNEGKSFLNPYMEQGQNAYGNLTGAMENLMNPEGLYNQFASGYETSPYAKQAQEMATNHGLNTAASMGLMGSTPALQAIQAETSRIGNADRENYINKLINQYIQGAGLAQNIYGTGANAAGQLANNAANMGSNSAESAYGQTNANSDLFQNLLGTAAGLGGNYMMMDGMMNNNNNNFSGAGGVYNPLHPNQYNKLWMNAFK